MTGELRVEAPGARASNHDHLVLRQRGRTLVFADSRMFGRVRFDVSAGEPPRWWRELPPAILSAGFTADRVRRFLRRRARSPVKSVLLDQSVFPGIGNWMADEILWRQRLHPLTPAGSLDARGARALWREVRSVARRALAIVGTDWGEFPLSWLHRHRWGSGEVCPRCGTGLVREAAAGRTTCSCPRCQPAPSPAHRGRAVAGGRRRERPGGRAG
jgi:formamidopyrimidine-DNA glycosylase